MWIRKAVEFHEPHCLRVRGVGGYFLNHTVFQDAPSVLNHGRVCGLEKPLHFLNHTVSESEARGSGSKSNMHEVGYLCPINKAAF